MLNLCPLCCCNYIFSKTFLCTFEFSLNLLLRLSYFAAYFAFKPSFILYSFKIYIATVIPIAATYIFDSNTITCAAPFFLNSNCETNYLLLP